MQADNQCTYRYAVCRAAANRDGLLDVTALPASACAQSLIWAGHGACSVLVAPDVDGARQALRNDMHCSDKQRVLLCKIKFATGTNRTPAAPNDALPTPAPDTPRAHYAVHKLMLTSDQRNVAALVANNVCTASRSDWRGTYVAETREQADALLRTLEYDRTSETLVLTQVESRYDSETPAARSILQPLSSMPADNHMSYPWMLLRVDTVASCATTSCVLDVHTSSDCAVVRCCTRPMLNAEERSIGYNLAVCKTLADAQSLAEQYTRDSTPASAWRGERVLVLKLKQVSEPVPVEPVANLLAHNTRYQYLVHYHKCDAHDKKRLRVNDSDQGAWVPFAQRKQVNTYLAVDRADAEQVLAQRNRSLSDDARDGLWLISRIQNRAPAVAHQFRML